MALLYKILRKRLLFVLATVCANGLTAAVTLWWNAQLAGIIKAAFLKYAFDAVGRNDSTGLTSACMIFGVASFCLFLYNETVWSIYVPFAVRIERKLRVKLYDKISSFSYERIESVPQSEWLTQLNTVRWLGRSC